MKEIELILRNRRLIMKGYCPSCRKRIDNSQNFCVNCGYKLD
jgi:predicted amidophosphoribosyltransferase